MKFFTNNHKYLNFLAMRQKKKNKRKSAAKHLVRTAEMHCKTIAKTFRVSKPRLKTGNMSLHIMSKTIAKTLKQLIS
jgi:hypothetical protein